MRRRLDVTAKASLFLSLFLILLLNLFLYSTTNLNQPSSSFSLPSFRRRKTHHHLFAPPPPPLPRPTSSGVKPWPLLPSFIPWSLNASLPRRSCEAYFGHGYVEKVEFLKSDSAGKFFRCFFSDTLQSSVCEMGMVRMDPEKIRMSKGGEEIETVIGRSDDEELPNYDEGSFLVGAEDGEGNRRIVGDEELDKYVPVGAVHFHAMRNLIRSVTTVPAQELELDCHQWIEDPVLFVTRFEYANLFHTITDWYNAYVASRVAGLTARPRLVFLDGHSKTRLEEAWEALFSSVQYAKRFSGPVCFRHAILSPLGYETALFKGLSESINCEGSSALDLVAKPDNHKTARLNEFGEMLRASFNISVEDSSPNKHLINVLFVRREDYLAHPRHSGKVESRLSNEQEVFDAIEEWVSTKASCGIKLVNGLFAHMPLKDQIQAIQEASVIIGAHGAGLTYILAANPTAIILEIISALYRRPHFRLIAEWKGLLYNAIDLPGSEADPAVVIDHLSSILEKLGCS